MTPAAPDPRPAPASVPLLLLVLLAWTGAVTLAAASGLLAALWQPAYAGLVALGILLPALAYARLPSLRALAERIGLRALTAFHIWRIPAALVFFWYGAQGQLPPLFWILAGTGDLIAGAWALAVTRRPGADRAALLRMHRFGMADFAVAVGTGLIFTLLGDPRMAPLATLPLALIPLFGVGLSGAAHLVAFDLMRRPARRGAA